MSAARSSFSTVFFTALHKYHAIRQLAKNNPEAWRQIQYETHDKLLEAHEDLATQPLRHKVSFSLLLIQVQIELGLKEEAIKLYTRMTTSDLNSLEEKEKQTLSSTIAAVTNKVNHLLYLDAKALHTQSTAPDAKRHVTLPASAPSQHFFAPAPAQPITAAVGTITMDFTDAPALYDYHSLFAKYLLCHGVKNLNTHLAEKANNELQIIFRGDASPLIAQLFSQDKAFGANKYGEGPDRSFVILAFNKDKFLARLVSVQQELKDWLEASAVAEKLKQSPAREAYSTSDTAYKKLR